MFIHGAQVSPAVWRYFMGRYAACGYACVAPAWPIAGRDIGELVAYFEQLIRAYPVPPLLVGHALGGLIVQILLCRGLGTAGIAITPVPPQGISSALRSLPGVLHKLCRLPGAQNGGRLSGNAATAPLSIRSILKPENQVDFDNDVRAPLLLIAAEADRLVPAAGVIRSYVHHRRSAAETDFIRFPGRSHWLIVEAGWEDVADASLDWLQRRVARF